MRGPRRHGWELLDGDDVRDGIAFRVSEPRAIARNFGNSGRTQTVKRGASPIVDDIVIADCCEERRRAVQAPMGRPN